MEMAARTVELSAIMPPPHLLRSQVLPPCSMHPRAVSLPFRMAIPPSPVGMPAILPVVVLMAALTMSIHHHVVQPFLRDDTPLVCIDFPPRPSSRRRRHRVLVVAAAVELQACWMMDRSMLPCLCHHHHHHHHHHRRPAQQHLKLAALKSTIILEVPPVMANEEVPEEAAGREESQIHLSVVMLAICDI